MLTRTLALCLLALTLAQGAAFAATTSIDKPHAVTAEVQVPPPADKPDRPADVR